jgi:hypothetical protein
MADVAQAPIVSCSGEKNALNNQADKGPYSDIVAGVTNFLGLRDSGSVWFKRSDDYRSINVNVEKVSGIITIGEAINDLHNKILTTRYVRIDVKNNKISQNVNQKLNGLDIPNDPLMFTKNSPEDYARNLLAELKKNNLSCLSQPQVPEKK